MNLAAAPGFHVPPVTELFEFGDLFHFQIGGLVFHVTFVTIVMYLLTAIVAALFLAGFRRPAIIPGSLQNMMEAGVDAVRENITMPTIGPDGDRYLPFLTAMFFFVFALNFVEVVPVIQFPITSHMAIPFFLAVISYFTFIIIGIRKQGPLTYFKDAIVIPGVPKPILPLLILIELVSKFVFRPVTLAVRLFANMMAGHVMLTIFFAASAYFIYISDSVLLKIFSPGPVVLSIILTGFEMFIALIQAFIITILTAVYIDESLHPAH
jgi:F-type H+-transporting ATPase subunit a